MEFKITFGPEWVEVQTSGPATLEGFWAFSEEVAADLRWPPGQKLLIDHSQLDLTTMSEADMRSLGQRASNGHPLRDCPRCAFYVPGNLQYTMGRMWKSLRDNPDQGHTRLFDSRENAIAWLREE